MQESQTRGQAYISLSRLLQEPGPELLELISGSGFQDLWRKIEVSHNIRFPESWEAGVLPGFDEWKRLWNITMGPVKPLAEPIESLYKIWTNDESCEMPFAKEKGYLKGDWACHMEELLTGPGFEIPPQFAHCPDHLVLELEFASILAEEAPAEALIMFAEHHFDWLEDLFETVKNKNAPKMYQDLYYLCLQYVKADIQSLL